jgi:hypothetical protein
MLEGIDEHILQIGDWTTGDAHYKYHINEKVPPQQLVDVSADYRVIYRVIRMTLDLG